MSERPPLVLHIGPHKTGSTSLQRYLAEHTRRLRWAGLTYPRAGRVNGHHGLLPAVCAPELISTSTAPAGTDPQQVVDDLVAEVGPATVPVLSSEMWWRLVVERPDAFERGWSMLDRHFDVRVVYVRRPAADKSWSAAKHQAMLGRAIPVLRSVATDMARDRQGWRWLAQHHRDVTVVEYGSDTTGTVLEALLDLAPEPSRLGLLIRARRLTSRVARRHNSAPDHPAASAVCLGVSQALWQSADSGELHRPALAEFLRRVPGEAPDHRLSVLPTDPVLRDRVIGSGPSPDGDDLAALLEPAEAAALRGYLRCDRIRRIAADAGVAQLVDTAANRLDSIGSLPAPGDS